MRGKATPEFPLVTSIGITPAYAGKRYGNNLYRIVKRDHPRLCGEKPETYCVKICRTGSPPPMRGKDGFSVAKGAIAGITPAYAGKSHGADFVFLGLEDHPRLCGEKKNTGDAECGCTRITPAYAGKSST